MEQQTKPTKIRAYIAFGLNEDLEHIHGLTTEVYRQMMRERLTFPPVSYPGKLAFIQLMIVDYEDGKAEIEHNRLVKLDEPLELKLGDVFSTNWTDAGRCNGIEVTNNGIRVV